MQGGSPTVVDGNHLPKVSATVESINSQKSVPDSPLNPEPETHAASGSEKVSKSVHSAHRGQHVAVPRGRGRGITKARGSSQLGRSKSEENGGWTGAGFDVDDGPS